MANGNFIAVFIEEADVPQALPTGLAGGPEKERQLLQVRQLSRRTKCCLGPPPPRMGAQVEAARPHWSHVWLWPLTPGGQGPRWGRRGFQTQASFPAGPEGPCGPFEIDPRSGRGGWSGLHPERLQELVPRKAEAAQTPARWAASQTHSPTTLAVPRACSCSLHLGPAHLRPTAPDVQMPRPKAHVVQEDQGSPSPSASAAPDFILQLHEPRVSETGSHWFCVHLPANWRQGQRLPTTSSPELSSSGHLLGAAHLFLLRRRVCVLGACDRLLRGGQGAASAFLRGWDWEPGPSPGHSWVSGHGGAAWSSPAVSLPTRPLPSPFPTWLEQPGPTASGLPGWGSGAERLSRQQPHGASGCKAPSTGRGDPDKG